MSVRFVMIPGQPVGKGRPRFVRSTGHVYTPEKTRDYESRVRQLYNLLQYGEPLIGPVRLSINAVFQLPKNKRKALSGTPYTGRPDIDNVAKCIQDALNGLAYRDDSQVTELVINMRYCSLTEEAHVSVFVEEARP